VYRNGESASVSADMIIAVTPHCGYGTGSIWRQPLLHKGLRCRWCIPCSHGMQLRVLCCCNLSLGRVSHTHTHTHTHHDTCSAYTVWWQCHSRSDSCRRLLVRHWYLTYSCTSTAVALIMHLFQFTYYSVNRTWQTIKREVTVTVLGWASCPLPQFCTTHNSVDMNFSILKV